MSHDAVLWVLLALGCLTVVFVMASIRINRETVRLNQEAARLWGEAERINAATLKRLREMKR